MSVIVVLEWQFSPLDYFEEPITISRDDYTMVIEKGKVEVRIPATIYDANQSIRGVIHEALNDRFLGIELLSHKPYELSKSSMVRLYPDGRRDIFLEVEPCRIKVSVGMVDIQLVDKDGNIVSDTKRDRIEKKKSLAELISTYRATDTLLNSLLNSYHVSVRDPANELVHLYEIRDALSAQFGGEEATKSMLNISSSHWSRLGQLCNDEPLRQGRHRGKSIGILRDATEFELAEARGIAQAMVESYLRHLDKNTHNRP